MLTWVLRRDLQRRKSEDTAERFIAMLTTQDSVKFCEVLQRENSTRANIAQEHKLKMTSLTNRGDASEQSAAKYNPYLVPTTE